MSPLCGDPEEQYTKCHQCGRWDSHERECPAGLREAYVAGRIEVEEFERGLDLTMQKRPWLLGGT